MVRKFVPALLLILPFTLLSQGFGLGLNPSKMKWRQIDTDKVQVIYPVGLEHRAQRAANIMTMLYDSSYYALGNKDDKITMIVQNQTTISNGFVSPFGPIRTEFFTTPPQFSFLGNVEWWDALTIHEYRHVEQVYNARRGWTKVASILFGQNGLGGAAGLAMPRWFFEGDATFYETQLTNAGRGRTPDFDKEYRSLMLDDRFYGYEKASAFSLKDFVPNHYAQGYYMTTHIRRKYGDDAMTLAAQNATAYKVPFWPFSDGLKRQTGLRSSALYRETFEGLQEEWKKESAEIELTNSTKINGEKKAFTSYRLPVFLNENELIIEKRGFQDIRQLVKVDLNGKEEKIITPGLYGSDNSTHSVKNGQLVWTELAYDERWANQDFSIVKSLALGKSTPKKVTSRSKYFAPDLSPDGSQIVVVEVTPNTEYRLVLLDSKTGSPLKVLSNPENYFFSFPRFDQNGDIVAIAQKNSKNSLAKIDVDTEDIRLLTVPKHEQISYPRPYGNYIFYSNIISGIDNIYVFDLEKGEEYQVTSTLLGATQPDISPSGKKIAFSEFTADGWDLRIMDLDPSTWMPVKSSYPTEIDFWRPVSKYGSILDKVPNEQFETKKFNKFSGLANLHSWSPVAIHPEYGGGISFDNKFSTFSAQGFYQYNVNEETSSWSAGITYAEFYPVLEAEARFTDRSRVTRFYFQAEEDEPGASVDGTVRWDERDINGGVRIPINLTSGNHFGSLEVAGIFHQIDVDYENDVTGTDGFFSAMEFEADFSRFQTRARQQVAPRWGQIINIDYWNTLNTTSNESEYFQITGRFFLPGIHKLHGLSIRGGFRQENSEASYKFRDIFAYARGYNVSINSDEIWVAGVDYTFPIWLPDVALGPLAFIKRVKGSVFADLSESTLNPIRVRDLTPLSEVDFRGTFEEFKREYKSVGFDLRFDFRALRIIEIDAGIRYAYLFDGEEIGLDRHRFLPIVATIGF